MSKPDLQRDDLLGRLQQLGDAEHDDCSVAYDAIEEIERLRLEQAEHGVTTVHVTLRDHFAAAALQGIIACPISSGSFMDLAAEAYEYADAMLDVRNEATADAKEASNRIKRPLKQLKDDK